MKENENEFEFDELDESYPTIMMEDEFGEEREYVVVASISSDGHNYILVLESELMDDDEAEATILKEISTENDEVVYGVIEDDKEFEKVVVLFQNDSDDYDIEI